MDYKEYLKTEDWKQKRALKNSKRRRCAICGSTKNIEVHHLIYKNLFDITQTDLRKLCQRCHSLTHKLYKDGKIVFTSANHHSRFGIIKGAVKRELGISTVNMFYKANESFTK